MNDQKPIWEQRLDELIKVLDDDKPEELQAFWDKYVNQDDWPCYVELVLQPEEYSKYVNMLGYPHSLDKAKCTWYYPTRSQGEGIWDKLHEMGMLMNGAGLSPYGYISLSILDNRVWELRQQRESLKGNE